MHVVRIFDAEAKDIASTHIICELSISIHDAFKSVLVSVQHALGTATINWHITRECYALCQDSDGAKLDIRVDTAAYEGENLRKITGLTSP